MGNIMGNKPSVDENSILESVNNKDKIIKYMDYLNEQAGMKYGETDDDYHKIIGILEEDYKNKKGKDDDNIVYNKWKKILIAEKLYDEKSYDEKYKQINNSWNMVIRFLGGKKRSSRKSRKRISGGKKRSRKSRKHISGGKKRRSRKSRKRLTGGKKRRSRKSRRRV